MLHRTIRATILLYGNTPCLLKIAEQHILLWVHSLYTVDALQEHTRVGGWG